MEFPHLGKHCSEPTCNRLDFLPVKCDACSNIYCSDHMTYSSHSCPSAYKKDVQVPICPLCGSPVPTPRNQSPDLTVGEHIDRDCQSDPAKANRKKNANRCNAAGCKVKEMVPVLCTDCRKNFCLRHRFPDDHKCQGKRGNVLTAAEKRTQNTVTPTINSYQNSIQGNMSEDEALARALQESMRDQSRPTNRRVVNPGADGNSQRCRLS